ncbi:MAG: hypothetical protein ABI779_22500 [Acidobacteriota bacterium]
MSTDNEADYEKAKAWLRTLTDQVLRLRMDHRVWEELQAMISANTDLHRPSEFYRWVKDMYVSGMAMSIRRQTDDDSRSVSFYRFLKLLKGNPSHVSRQRYRSLFKGDEIVEQLKELDLKGDYFNDDYDRLVGTGKMQPSIDDIQAELDDLERVTGKITTFANKVIAHHDERKPKALPKFSEVDDAIRFLEDLVKRYRLLFEAASMSTDVAFLYDWKAIFRIPWIPKR